MSGLYFLPGYMWGCPCFIFFLVICEGVMSLFSSWIYETVWWRCFLPGYMWGCHGFIFFLIIYECVMALISSWLYMRVSWLYFLPGYMWGVSWLCFLPGYMRGCHGFIFFLITSKGVMTPSHIARKKNKATTPSQTSQLCILTTLNPTRKRSETCKNIHNWPTNKHKVT